MYMYTLYIILFGTSTCRSAAIVDSNYFDDSFNPIQQSFKGVLTSDTTLMIYHYEVDGIGLIDTFQVKEFIKQ